MYKHKPLCTDRFTSFPFSDLAGEVLGDVTPKKVDMA